MSELVRTIDVEEGIAEVRLNRPEARNALSQALLDDLLDAVEEVSTRAGVRVVILGAEGKAFCAGMDLKAVRSEPAKMGDLLMTISQVLRSIRRSPQVYVARVQGAAIGGGCGLACVCDFAVTHAEAKVGYPEVDLGVCPAVVAPWLIRRIGAGRARQMLLAGGTMSGQEGYAAGLATHLAGADELEAATLELTRRIAKGGPNALTATKKWLNELDGSMDDDLLDEAARISARIVQGDEAQSRLRGVFEGG